MRDYSRPCEGPCAGAEQMVVTGVMTMLKLITGMTTSIAHKQPPGLSSVALRPCKHAPSCIPCLPRIPCMHGRATQLGRRAVQCLSPGGRDCLSFSALSESCTLSVYRYLEQRTLNLVTPAVFLILTDLASLRRAVSKKSLISLICFGCTEKEHVLGRLGDVLGMFVAPL